MNFKLTHPLFPDTKIGEIYRQKIGNREIKLVGYGKDCIFFEHREFEFSGMVGNGEFIRVTDFKLFSSVYKKVDYED